MLSRLFHKSVRGGKRNKGKTSRKEQVETEKSSHAETYETETSDDHERVSTDGETVPDLCQALENIQTETKQIIPPPLLPKNHSVPMLDNTITLREVENHPVSRNPFFCPSNLLLEAGKFIYNNNIESDDDGSASTASEGLAFHVPECGTKPRSLSLSVFPRAIRTPYKQTRRIFVDRKKKNAADFEIKYVRVHGPSDGAYKNQSEPRGYIFIKNFERFDGSRFEKRSGSDKDFSNLLHLFEGIGYKKCQKCCESGHITKDKLIQDIEAFRNLDHTLYDSAIIIIMSHGVKDKTFVTSDNEEVDLLEIYSMFSNFNCEGLRNKPKIFVLQFCRPKSTIQSTLSNASLIPQSLDDTIINLKIREQVELMKTQLREEMQAFVESSIRDTLRSMNINCTLQNAPESSLLLPANETNEDNPPGLLQMLPDEVITPSIDAAPRSVLLEADARKLQTNPSVTFTLDSTPDYSDMYSIFSTNSGGVAYRDPRKGSLLIQAICHVFSSHAYQDDIEELVRKVSKNMQQELSKDDPLSSHHHAVVERVNNGLDKAFYFNPYEIKDRKRYTTVG